MTSLQELWTANLSVGQWGAHHRERSVRPFPIQAVSFVAIGQVDQSNEDRIVAPCHA